DQVAQFLKDPKALYVQTSVGLSDGDSGGALVNEHGQLVGLNLASVSGRNLSHHVHASELKTFLSHVSDTPEDSLPSAWLSDARNIQLSDTSFDGVIDTLRALSPSGTSLMFDLPQTTFTRGQRFQNERDLHAKKGFHADFAYVRRGADAYAYYD